jgi:alpha-galactosidase
VANEHPEWRKEKNGKPVNIGPVWETEESWGMCLVSDYADWFIDKLVEIGERLGVRYFKWDAVDLRGCDSAYHHHGGEDCSPEERERNFRFECVRSLTHIASEVSRRLPGAIVDLDITERGRAVGLGFLAGGKFFAMNNGPYYLDFDIPDAANSHRDNWNVFFWPGTARNEVCRQPLAFDAIVPSVLNLTHFLPDGPSGARQNALVSLYLGGNGIWGDLGSLDADGIAELAEGVSSYKAVASDLTEAYPITRGFIGASPEVHEKLNPATGRGIVAFFTREPLDAEWLTQPLAGSPKIKGADEVQKMSDRRYLLRLHLGKDEARAVFFA